MRVEPEEKPQDEQLPETDDPLRNWPGDDEEEPGEEIPDDEDE